MKQRRVGMIIIPYDQMFTELTEAMFAWLRFVPLHVEWMGHTDKYECYGMSHEFAVSGVVVFDPNECYGIDRGSVAPEYRIECTVIEGDDKKPELKFKAIKV